MPSTLSISVSDPTACAGIQADLRTFALLGVRGTSVVSALSVQDSTRIHSVLPVFPSVVIEQIRVLLSDWTPDAVKVGMLASDDVARGVQLGLASLEGRVPMVIDPVLVAHDGTVLLERRAWSTLKELIRGCQLVTPSLTEAEYLSGVECTNKKQCERAARIFLEDLGAETVLISSNGRSDQTTDLLASSSPSGIEFEWLASEPPASEPIQGRNCALSSAATAGLARGWPIERAIRSARAFVRNERSDSAPIVSEAVPPEPTGGNR